MLILIIPKEKVKKFKNWKELTEYCINRTMGGRKENEHKKILV